MKSIFLTIGDGLNLMITPNVQTHLNGHVILTYTYSIFLNNGLKELRLSPDEGYILRLDKITDPDYYGYLTFEKPGKLFSYIADGQKRLEAEEVNELIEKLSHIRDNPSLWNLKNDI